MKRMNNQCMEDVVPLPLGQKASSVFSPLCTGRSFSFVPWPRPELDTGPPRCYSPPSLGGLMAQDGGFLFAWERLSIK